MPDLTQTAQTKERPWWQTLGQPQASPPADSGGLAQALTGTPQSQTGLLGALANLIQFVQAKPGSGSTMNRTQKALTDAGIPAEDTGVGNNQSH